MVPRPPDLQCISSRAWTIINKLYPADVISLLDALVSSHREKIGYPHHVSNLTIAHVIQCLRYSDPDDSATLDYNKSISFVGNLLNRTDNRIPETRADTVKMHKAITTVLTAMPSDIEGNMEQFLHPTVGTGLVWFQVTH